MGCSYSVPETIIYKKKSNAQNIVNINTNIEDELKIYSGMLVCENKGLIKDNYSVIKQIGSGSFGKVFKVKNIKTGYIYAMKVVKKSTLSHQRNKNFVLEISILKHLDHPNILKLYEYFMDDKYFYFIMEYVSGGELYQKILEMKNYDERSAALIMKEILSSVTYLHQMGIVHRDLKPENLMINMVKDKIEVKLIDFGTADYVKKGKKLTSKVGSPYYIAPEVIKCNYSYECDLWSCGVILYLLLVGYPPFGGNDKEDIFKKILIGNYKISGDEWDKVSEEGKDLVKKLLEKNPSYRITAQKALKDPWIVKNTQNNNLNIDKKRRLSLVNSLQRFYSKQKLHQASVAFIVHHMSNNSMVRKLTSIFKELDESGEGLLSKEELKKGYHKFFSDELTEPEFEEIMEKIDQDKSGEISIEEFLRVTIKYESIVSEKNLRYAFDCFDKDHSGKLSKKEIIQVLGLNIENPKTMDIVNKIIKEVDINGDGEINFEEFRLMMLKNYNEN